MEDARDDEDPEALHVRALGNPKEYRERYMAAVVARASLDVARLDLHNGSYWALIELADSIGGEKTCLLCFEEQHDLCHRAVIAGAVAERLPSVAVVHL